MSSIRKRKAIITVFSILIACTLAVLIQASAKVFAGDVTEKTDVKITEFSISHEDVSNTNPEFKWYERFKVKMSWDASAYGNKLKAGDYFITKLPDKFHMYENNNAKKFNLIAPGGEIMGHGEVFPKNGGGGSIKVTFNKYVEDRYNVKGTMQLTAKFTHIETNKTNRFEVSVGSNVKIIEVPIGEKKGIKDEILAKWGSAKNKEDKIARWSIRINHKKGTFGNFKLKDELSVKEGSLNGIHYLKNTFKLHEVEMDQFGGITKWGKTIDLEGRIKFSDNDTKYTIDFGDLLKDGKQYFLQYESTYIPGMTLLNKATGFYDQKETKSYSHFKNATSEGTGQGDLLGKIKIVKVDAENSTKPLKDAVFKIRNLTDNSSFELTTDEKGEAISDKLIPGKYEIQEVKAPKGYKLDSTKHVVEVTSSGAVIKTIKNVPELTSVSGKKTWDDNNNKAGKRPKKILVNLLADEEKVADKIVTEKDGWKYTFDKLPKYKDGKEIQYTVTENSVAGYNTEIKGYDITNKYTPKETSVTVTKNWKDEHDKNKKRPKEIKVQLYANGTKYGSPITLNKENKWTYTWNNLPEENAGKKIKYTVKEPDVPASYEMTVDDKDKGNIIITNTYRPGAPETGDNTRAGLWIVLAIAALAGIGIIVKKKK